MYQPTEIITLAQKIVRGNYLNFDRKTTFLETSSIYRFTNEDITSYFHHLENKPEILTVIGSGNQILNSILAGTRNITCFDISIFPEYYLYLQLASIASLSKEDYLNYYLSNDREELFHEKYYDLIASNLPTQYQKFWNQLYLFDDGITIYDSLLFRQDFYSKEETIQNNPYLQDNNYQKLQQILKIEPLHLQTQVCNILEYSSPKAYDLINLSNILSYYFQENNLPQYKEFFEQHFSLKPNGKIISYFYQLSDKVIINLESLLYPHGKVENINQKKLLIYKK